MASDSSRSLLKKIPPRPRPRPRPRTRTRPQFASLAWIAVVAGCASSGSVRRFPLRDPLAKDDDARPYAVACKPDPKKPGHEICVPREYVSPFVWDGMDAMLFRPITRFLAVDPGGESVNVNALDEVPDSSWFTNRLGAQPVTPDDVTRGACEGPPLDPNAPDGTWVIDQGKANGANPGFRVNIKGVGKFLLKADEDGHPERATGATAIGTRLFHVAGYYTNCDTVVYARRSLLKLTPGLKYSDNTGVERPFDEARLDKMLGVASRRGDLLRLVASKWLPGRTIGPFRFTETRDDDPNDVIAHEDRRELRAQRVLSAWLAHFDSREQNTMNTWVSNNPKDPDASPGHIRHWIIDLNDCFGSEWQWDLLTKRINYSYYFDGGDIARDLFTFGLVERTWDKIERPKDGEIFGYFQAKYFEPHDWKGGYQNPAYQRMTERDGAWMARILARLSPEHVAAAVDVGQFTERRHRDYLLRTLLERQRKIFERYFSKLSPLADVEAKGPKVCAVDLARQTGLAPVTSFRYAARVRYGDDLQDEAPASVQVGDAGRLCVELPRIDAGSADRDDSPARYRVIEIANGQSESPLRVHLYDLGAERGAKLVGLER